ELIGASLLGAGLAGAAATPLKAASAHGCQPAKPIIDSHVHLWKLPRNAPPMSDFATFPTGCCGSVTWMEVDRQLPGYTDRVGIRIGGGIFHPGMPQSLANLRPNVLTNLTLLAKRGLEIDTLGILGAALSQIGAAVPSLTMVMDHFAGKPTTFNVEDSWKSDM